MSIKWGLLLDVIAVSSISTIAVVALVALALRGLSARAPRIMCADAPAPPVRLSPGAGTALAAASLSGAAAILLFGLWTLVVR
jgi:hypothetical protein